MTTQPHRPPQDGDDLRTGCPEEQADRTAARTSDDVIAQTRAWVDRVVIGLNLCPFAKAPQVKRQVRYVVSEATEPEALLACLGDELQRLARTSSESIETTLLIHPQVLTDFADYNDFLGVAEEAVRALGFEGVFQVASFHPQYRFAGAAPDDVSNATNRSPFPMLHLLREDSIDRAVAAFPHPEAIFQANIATMQRLGPDGWAALQQQCREDVVAATGFARRSAQRAGGPRKR